MSLLRVLSICCLGAVFCNNSAFAVVPMQAANTDKVVEAKGIIVKFKNANVKAFAAKRKISTLSTKFGTPLKLSRITATGSQVLKPSKQLTLAQLQSLAAQIAQDPSVEFSEPDWMLSAMMVPNDPRYNEQWHYYEPNGGLNLPPAWDLASGSNVVVAVLDTGFTDHIDLAANILPGYDMISDLDSALDGDARDADASDPGHPEGHTCQSSWHGTHVAGTIAAVTNNGLGVSGVAYNAKILPLRVLGACGSGATSDIADAILWAAGLPVPGTPLNPNPAQVINLSLGGESPCGPTMQSAIDRATAVGSTVVVSAGNSSKDSAGFSPAGCNNVISVSASTRTGGLASFSNYGEVVDIAAPGGDIMGFFVSDPVLSTVNAGSYLPAGDDYAGYVGTSMAAPHVAGLSALLYEVSPDITPAEVETIIKSTARPMPWPCYYPCGAGIADATTAVKVAAGLLPIPEPVDESVLVNGVEKRGLAGAQGEELHYTVTIPEGTTLLQIESSGFWSFAGDADLYVKFNEPPSLQYFDYSSTSPTRDELITIPDPVAGTYHVMVYGYTDFYDLDLVANYFVPTPEKTFINPNPYPIIDYYTTWSSVDVPLTGPAGNIQVFVDVSHPKVGTTYIYLVAPDGSRYPIKFANFADSSTRYVDVLTIDANATEATGTWTLYVEDFWYGNQGSLNRWSITFP